MKFPSPEFDAAVAELCHGTIGDVDLTELHELLRADSNAQDEYLWRVEVHSELATTKLDFGPSSAPEAASDPLQVLTAPPAFATNAGHRSHLFSSVIAASLVLVMLWGGLWVWSGLQPTANVVASFTGLHDVEWMTQSTGVQVGDSIQQGQRIELSSGSVEIEFSSGACLQLIGPAIVELLSDNSAFLMLGEVHVVAKTTESKGFRLTTRTSTFVDISTAFSATVAADGLSRLDVTEGEVDVVLEGAKSSPRLSAGETLYVEPGKRQIMTRIEEGDRTAEFRFPTIQPPSHKDLADQSLGRANIRVVQGKLNFKPGRGTSGPASVLVDGTGQSHQNAPMESAFFDNGTSGSLLIDFGSVHSISKINSYSWHQHDTNETHRHRARQRFILYGFSGDVLPDLNRPPAETGWTRIARVNSDQFFGVAKPLDRPAQQACSVTAAQGEIGRFRYLLWEAKHHTFFGELDVFGSR